jgi:hypothetical protein
MAVDLSDYVGTLRREVSPPGSVTFADVDDDVFTLTLADSFWEVRLDGFAEPFSADPDGIVVPVNSAEVVAGDLSYTLTPYDPAVDISRTDIALICLYAGIKIIRNRLMEQPSKTMAKAANVEFEQDFSANLLVEMLKELSATKQRLLYLKTYNQDVTIIDAFSARSMSASSYSGYLYSWLNDSFAFGAPFSDMYDVSGFI